MLESGLLRLYQPWPDWIANRRRRGMKKWQTPRVVEISCGCEINAYFPAEL